MHVLWHAQSPVCTDTRVCRRNLRGCQAQGLWLSTALGVPAIWVILCYTACFVCKGVTSVNPGHTEPPLVRPARGQGLAGEPGQAGSTVRVLPWAHTDPSAPGWAWAAGKGPGGAGDEPRWAMAPVCASAGPAVPSPPSPGERAETPGPGPPHGQPHPRGPTLRRVPRNSSLAKARRGWAVLRPRAEGPGRGRGRAERRARSSSSTALMAALGASLTAPPSARPGPGAGHGFTVRTGRCLARWDRWGGDRPAHGFSHPAPGRGTASQPASGGAWLAGTAGTRIDSVTAPRPHRAVLHAQGPRGWG